VRACLLFHRVVCGLQVISRTPTGRKYLRLAETNENCLATLKVLVWRLAEAKDSHTTSVLHSAVEHTLSTLWSLCHMDDGGRVYPVGSEHLERVYGLALTFKRPRWSRRFRLSSLASNHKPTAEIMLTNLKLNFASIINHMAGSSDLRAQQVGMWLLRCLSDTQSSFLGYYIAQGFFAVRDWLLAAQSPLSRSL
jgi:hypothetical protein